MTEWLCAVWDACWGSRNSWAAGIWYHIAQPDGSTLMDEINASFPFRIKRWPMEPAAGYHVNIMAARRMMGMWLVYFGASNNHVPFLCQTCGVAKETTEHEAYNTNGRHIQPCDSHSNTKIEGHSLIWELMSVFALFCKMAGSTVLPAIATCCDSRSTLSSSDYCS